MTRKLILTVAALPAAVGIVLWWMPGGGILGLLLRSYAVVFLTLGLGVVLAVGLRRALWRVGHRLAFSYFLIGVVPIPLVILMVLTAAYIANGFLLGHLYRDAVHSVAAELRFAAETHLDRALSRDPRRTSPIPASFAYYKDGRRFAGEARAPRQFQEWWVKETEERRALSPIIPPFVALADGRPTLMAAVSEGRWAVLAYYSGDLERELSERSGIWVELLRSDEDGGGRPFSFTLQDREYALRMPRLDWEDEELSKFFYEGEEDPGLLDHPSLLWAEITRPFLDLGRGTRAAEYVYATLTGSPKTIRYHLISRSAEVDTFAYLVLLALAIALFDIWVLAALMALLMISGLSQAVNKLSRATRQVRGGDFSARIDVLRNDQLGELHRSFNVMTENLETLVASATRKEVLERDLEIARQLQQSLLPGEITADETPGSAKPGFAKPGFAKPGFAKPGFAKPGFAKPGFAKTLCFATHFAPSAAIGGDYYDVLPVADGRLAVVVADVSGHGVAAGLRMAMVKSALQLLCEEEWDPVKIFGRLHSLQKSAKGAREESSRGFVTATLTLIDRESGEVEITNAGHSPTYLWRRGEVTEIVLPSSPLGALGGTWRQEKLKLEPGDSLVWLSDGLIEAVNGTDEPFGYDGVVRSLEEAEIEGTDDDASALRDHLLGALDAHTGGSLPEDDRTLVVMVYRPQGVAAEAGSSERGAGVVERPTAV